MLAASLLRFCRVMTTIGNLVSRKRDMQSKVSYNYIIRLAMALENTANRLDMEAKRAHASTVAIAEPIDAVAEPMGTLVEPMPLPISRAEVPKAAGLAHVPVESEQATKWVSQAVQTVHRRKEPVGRVHKERQQRWDKYCIEPAEPDKSSAEWDEWHDEQAAWEEYNEFHQEPIGSPAMTAPLRHGFSSAAPSYAASEPMMEESEAVRGAQPRHGFSTGTSIDYEVQKVPLKHGFTMTPPPAPSAPRDGFEIRSGTTMTEADQSKWVEQWRREREERQQAKVQAVTHEENKEVGSVLMNVGMAANYRTKTAHADGEVASAAEMSASTIVKPTKAAVPAWAKKEDEKASAAEEESKPEAVAPKPAAVAASKPSTASWLPRTAMTKLPAETTEVTVATSTSPNEIKSWTVKSEGLATSPAQAEPVAVGAAKPSKKKIRQQVPGFAI